LNAVNVMPTTNPLPGWGPKEAHQIVRIVSF
jgi:hypothetical protein